MSPTIKPTTCIDDLPLEMISELFEYLHPKDLAACSLVNWRWHSIYSNFKLHRLAVMRDEHEPAKWYGSNQPIQEAERCPPSMFPRLAEKPLLSNLKHLTLHTNELKFDLNKLNRFQQLVHLEINVHEFHQMMVLLNLPRLKVLVIRGCDDRTMTIDCPLLSTLVHYGILLDVKHPETIRMLGTDMVVVKLVSFKNIECFVTYRPEAINVATLLSLPELRELRYNTSIKWLFVDGSRHGFGTVDRMKRTLGEFLDEAKKLRGSDFQFRFSGFKLTKTMLEQIDFVGKVNERIGREYVSDEYIYMKNYHLIEPGAIDFVERVNYSRLLSNANGELPRCFSQKFTGIELVNATAKVQDADQFLWFLKSQRSLRRLWLTSTGLAQEFYDQLPASAPSLDSLIMRGRQSRLQLNFDFIGRFLRLSELDIWSPLSLESLPSLVRWLGRLKTGRFRVRSGEERFDVEKETNSFEWKKAGKSLFKMENPEEMANFFDRLQ